LPYPSRWTHLSGSREVGGGADLWKSHVRERFCQKVISFLTACFFTRPRIPHHINRGWLTPSAVAASSPSPCFTRPQVSMPPLRVFPHPRDLHGVGGGHDLHGAPCRPRPAEAPPGMSTPSFALPWPRPTPRTPPPTKSTTSSSLATVRRLTLLQPAAEASFPSRPSCLRTMEIVSKEKRHVLLREIWRRWASM